MSLIKSSKDIDDLRVAGRKLALVIRRAEAEATAGRTLLELDGLIHSWITQEGCLPSFLGFDGFPNASCLSVNQRVVHGIPDRYTLKEGDILGIDVGLWYGKVCVDGARTVAVGKVGPAASALLADTEDALRAGIRAAKPFRRVGSISQAVQEHAESRGHGIVRALTGHGVGHEIHEEPEVPNVGRGSDGILLRPGMVLAIEPMLTTGRGEVLTEIDGWGIVTADGSLSAQFEHTVLITPKGVEILTA